MEELLPKFYTRLTYPQAENDKLEITEHQLALLFGVFACGAAGDLTLPFHNNEGETYRWLARSALSLHPVFDGTTVATVQAVAILGAYDLTSNPFQTFASAFQMVSLALHLGISVSYTTSYSIFKSILTFFQIGLRMLHHTI